MTSIPAVEPPIRVETRWARHLPRNAALDWLSAGWRDTWRHPLPSLGYGFLVTVVSVLIVAGLFWLGWDFILLPALAGFMVMGPLLAIGLYEKSRRLAAGEPVSLRAMIFVRPKSGGQVLFSGALLLTLMLLWMRAAVLIYALFLGVQPFSGLADVLPMLIGTPTGWAILIVGSAVGALFAAFAFGISMFAIPMLLDQRTDALTAMGSSLALVWYNLPALLVWGAIVAASFALAVATGLLGLIVIFPVLGHGTWHAWTAVRAGVVPG
jgi:uncharacterized membrane protein